jgi:hypothetical protein
VVLDFWEPFGLTVIEAIAEDIRVNENMHVKIKMRGGEREEMKGNGEEDWK